MKPDDITNAIEQAILQGGQQWLVATIAAFMPALWAMTLIMHLSRPYVLRTLRKLSLRFGADVWWLSYVLVRDAITIVTFCLSIIFLMPNLILGSDLPLTAPLATLSLFLALYVKLLNDADDDFGAYRLVTLLLVAGATFYFIPQTFAIESTSQAYLTGVGGFLDSTTDQAWAGPILVVSLLGFAATAGSIFYRVVIASGRANDAEARRLGPAVPPKQAPAAHA
ncbi:MAG: hypothetical protein KGJ98_05280 [Chloroflexota bacterium]|nr:hypothetical protein [Chloroflexota bacterium]MDE3101631.1 hypothetical protein [Chloroflexota bacterium]